VSLFRRKEKKTKQKKESGLQRDLSAQIRLCGTFQVDKQLYLFKCGL